MSTSDENDVDAQEIPLEQLSEVAGGLTDVTPRSERKPHRVVRPAN